MSGSKKALDGLRTVFIDRTNPFDPVKFLGPGWRIAKQDDRLLQLSQLDLRQVRLVHMLERNETTITGEEKLSRLNEMDYICLDAKIFQILLETPSLIPKSWRKKSCVFFDGTVLLDREGIQRVLCLRYRQGQWGYDWCSPNRDWGSRVPSAVLKAVH